MTTTWQQPEYPPPVRPERRRRPGPWIALASALALVVVLATVLVVLARPWEGLLRGGIGMDPNRPRYDISARVEPSNGRVRGTVNVRVPARVGGDTLRFRVVPNAEGYDASFRLGQVTVDGERVEPTLTNALLTVPRSGDGRVEVSIGFAYTVVEGETSPLAALGLMPSDGPMVAGLLARYDTGMSMGHWYPFLVADGAAADATLPDTGDVGNAPVSDVRARITVPQGYTVISGGEAKGTKDEGGNTVVDERANGVRELSLVVSDALKPVTREASGVTVRVWAPADSAGEADEVATVTARALGVFEERFGAYAWPALDVVQAPMPPGVGGMEWQGMFWVGSEIFHASMPGLPKELGGMLGQLGGMRDVREFTVVHELAHQWWQGMVGVDQTADEVVDEPLAQYSSCVYFAETRPSDWKEVCDKNTSLNYRAMRTMGGEDAAADQPTSAFTDDKQYAGVVYGKAPNYYRALEELIGRDAVLAGLRSLAEDRSMDVVQPEDVVDALRSEAPAGKRAEVERLWRHWMHETHGDDDVGTEIMP